MSAADCPPDVRFERLYKDRFGAVYAYVLRRVEPSDVADLVADVFTVAWRRLDDLPPPPHDLPWLYGVARRVVSQHGRARCRRRHLLDRLARETRWLGTPVVPSEGGEPGDRLAAAVAVLGPRDRELLRLVAWEGLSHVEAALVLGCSANA